MGIPLSEWDRFVGPLLAEMRLDASWIQWYAAKLTRAMGQLPLRPVWSTQAEDEIHRATEMLAEILKQVTIAMQQLQEAKAAYAEKKEEK